MPFSIRTTRSTRALALVLSITFLAGCGGGSGTESAAASGPGATAGPSPTPGSAASPTAAAADAAADAAAPSATSIDLTATGTPATGTPTIDGADTATTDATASPAPSPPDTRVAAGAACTLSYTLTASPLLSGADPLLPGQWHLRNTGQSGGVPGEDSRALDAWALTRGAGVRVAVVDDAIELTHADLRSNLVEGASRSFRPGNPWTAWPVPCTEDEGHGTGVAGVLLARDDDAIGGAGVAPRASLVAFDALATGLDVDIAAALGSDPDLNAVYQNSWGPPDNGALHPSDDAFRATIARGIATGRGGRGSIYVFAAGNGGCYALDGAGRCWQDDANYDGWSNRLGVIAVCAVDAAGRRPWYGERGATLAVCAPSGDAAGTGATIGGIVTTALRDGYRSDFAGTSAAAPTVSGVVALMLSVNPSLTWRDVRLILATTARRNVPADAGWEDSALRGAASFNHAYGYGVVDAAAAVRAARSWASVGGSDTLRRCEVTRAPSLALPDASRRGATTTVSDAATVSGCGITRIEWVEVGLSSDHPYPGDLQVRLVGPAGRVSRLAEQRACNGGGAYPCGLYADWTFGSMRHLDEAADGTWTLQVADRAWGDAGTLQRWRIVLYGR